MENKSFTFTYPKDSGFGKTEIMFYSGTPDLISELFPGKGEYPRLFVTDTSIASLDYMKSFISLFTESSFHDDASVKFSGTYEKDVLLILGPGEKYKTMESVLAIVRTALDHDFTRQCKFVAVGGGVICDMTAFAASIFKRGIDCEFVPTTLLSMVDAAIGGKTGCDFDGYKNMIGSFWPAKKLYVWSDFVKTLPAEEYLSGLAEAIKTAFLFSKELCSLFSTQKEKVLSRDSKTLELCISECVKAKAEIVQEDFREHGKRAFLNLGHTFGHALEAVAGLGAITHGEAVAWGMARANALAAKKGYCSEEFENNTAALLSSYGYDTAAQPEVLAGKTGEVSEKLLSAMHKDKKNITNTIRVILQKDFCDTLITEVSDEDLRSVLSTKS